QQSLKRKFPELEAIERDYRTMLLEHTKLVVEHRRLDLKGDLKGDLADFANVIDDENASNGDKDASPE
ncbi:hypothetical protein BGZ49_006503, partial [Haplosporangium sp. Z 27]